MKLTFRKSSVFQFTQAMFIVFNENKDDITLGAEIIGFVYQVFYLCFINNVHNSGDQTLNGSNFKSVDHGICYYLNQLTSTRKKFLQYHLHIFQIQHFSNQQITWHRYLRLHNCIYQLTNHQRKLQHFENLYQQTMDHKKGFVSWS